MSFPSLRGRSQRKANSAAHSKLALLVLMLLVLSFFLTVASRMSHAQSSFPVSIPSAEAQLEEGRTTLDEHMLMAARRSFEDCTRKDLKNSRCYYDLGRTDSYIADIR